MRSRNCMMKAYKQPQIEVFRVETVMTLATSTLPASIDDPVISGARMDFLEIEDDYGTE